MSDALDKAIAVGGTLTALLATWMYNLYKNKSKEACQIQEVETVKIGEELKARLREANDHCIPYAAVHGIVTEMGKSYRTDKSSGQGVVLKTTLVEHKSKRIQGIWSDSKKVVLDTLDVAPFSLSDSGSPRHLMAVVEPTEACRLLDELEVTHHEFKPHKTSVIQAGLDRIFGEVCRGYEKTEEMLVVGTSLIGLGEIRLQNNNLKIGPPQLEDKRYILTTLTKNQLIKTFNSQATTFKVLTIIFGVMATGMIGFVMWRVTRKYIERKKTQKQLEEVRQAALRRRAQGRGETPDDSQETCVVCMTNAREVVTLDCGHISMCSDCVRVLPQPHKCPVCREPIIRFLPVYHP